MTPAEFQVQLNRLAETFGKNAYGTERAKLIWLEVQDYDSHWLKSLVDRFIGELRQAPLLPEFRDAISKERERGAQSQKLAKVIPIHTVYHCDYCRDNGVFLCRNTNPEIGGVWAFRCHCSRGFNDPRAQIPQFKQAHKEQGFYYIEPPQRNLS